MSRMDGKKTHTHTRNVVDATRLGEWLRSGEGIGWLAAGTMPNSLYRVPFSIFFWHVYFCYSRSFLFVVFVCLCLCFFFFCSHWSLVDVALIFFCPADHVPDWQPRILQGMVEARSVNVKKYNSILFYFLRGEIRNTPAQISHALPKDQRCSRVHTAVHSVRQPYSIKKWAIVRTLGKIIYT